MSFKNEKQDIIKKFEKSKINFNTKSNDTLRLSPKGLLASL